MSGLTLKLRDASAGRVDLSALVPHKLAGMDERDIAQIVIGKARDQLRVGDVFDISGTPGDTLTFVGTTAACDGLGSELEGGTIIVDGNAGAYAGRTMKSGRLDIRGSAGDFLAAGLKGGLVTVKGTAGDFVGAVLTGEKNGMAGGTVVVEGNIGERAGDRMRRGTIITRGTTGASAGSRMLGGTIWAEGGLGPSPGSLLRRGTLIAPSVARMPDTFGDCGRHDLGILAIMSKHFTETLGALAPKPLPKTVRRFAGDLATAGKGEILLIA
jgi:formylmethanofuran dehydrogenase subunit C